MVFVRVHGEGVEGASLKACEAAILRLPKHVVNKFAMGGVMGLRDVVEKKILTQLMIKGALGCTTPAEWWYLF